MPVSGALSNLNWGSQQTLWLRWIERNDTGNDHGLAIDDFSLAAAAALLWAAGCCTPEPMKLDPEQPTLPRDQVAWLEDGNGVKVAEAIPPSWSEPPRP